MVADLDGAVRAMVGGVDYSESQFNRATDALRQPGSSFKPYVYAAALMNGFKVNSKVVDGPVCVGNWCPKNYSGGYSGSMSLTAALTRSINTIAVKLSIAIGKGNARIGRGKIVALARAMGLRTPLPRHAVAADRRRRGDRARPHHRLCDLPQCAARRCRRMPFSKCAPGPARRSGGSTATARSRCR